MIRKELIITSSTAYKVASVELIALMIRRNADLNARYDGRTARDWALRNGDKSTATLIEKCATMIALCGPRSVSRLGGADTWIRIVPEDLMKELSEFLFPPLFQMDKAIMQMEANFKSLRISKRSPNTATS